MEIVLLIGAAPYPLPERSARYLLNWIREFAGDGRGTDDSGRALRRLADALEEDLAAGSSPEPLELDWRNIEVIGYGLRDHLIAGDDALTRLAVACRRLRSEPPPAYFGN